MKNLNEIKNSRNFSQTKNLVKKLLEEFNWDSLAID